MTGEPALLARLRGAAADEPIVVGHRGDSGAFPENTLPAFAAAVAAGAVMVEFDVQVTRDGHLVCLHDDSLDRTTDAAVVLGRSGVRVGEVDLRDVARLDAGSWFAAEHRGTRVPTLAEALAVVQRGAIAMIEHKSGSAAAVVDVLRAVGVTDAVIVQSFAWDFVAEVHRLAPEVLLGALGEGPLDDDRLAALPATGAKVVHWNIEDLRAEDIGRLHDRGYLVCVYTANSDAALVGAAQLGIDAITTNRPGRLRRLIDAGLARRPGASFPAVR
ncbi:MAG TPA: glycerophosphodiester phosphodiesterase family protein [Planctomycetota bacterium]|nr:glycerophosphodiester phosphodiesterase family protein [Planctomycetota bacterium]